MSLHLRPHFFTLVWLICFSFHAPGLAQFQPISLSPESFTQDVVVEKSAPAPALPVTTASMEAGAENLGFTWFEKGYVGEWPSAGLPAAGATFASEHSLSHHYQMPGTYRTNKSFQLRDSFIPDR